MSDYITSESEREVLSPGPLPLSTGANWTSSDCGKTTGQATGPALLPGTGLLAINGNTDLSGCVVGNYGACVYQVYTSQSSTAFGYEIWVQAQGPSGVGSGSIWLTFVDQSGDPYGLRIFDSTKKWHFVRYSSKKPGLTSMNWNDSKP